jgi:hypothetical protein
MSPFETNPASSSITPRELTGLPTPQTGKISLVIAPRQVSPQMMTMLATLALRGRVVVVDGGNRFDGYALARELRRQTPRVQETLKRILLSRAFTCYQTMALLAKLPVDGTPVVVLDLLATFRDENVSWGKRRRLLDSSLNLLKRISACAPVAVWACTHAPPLKEDPLLLTALLEIAHDTWKLQELETPTHQLPLF